MDMGYARLCQSSSDNWRQDVKVYENHRQRPFKPKEKRFALEEEEEEEEKKKKKKKKKNVGVYDVKILIITGTACHNVTPQSS